MATQAHTLANKAPYASKAGTADGVRVVIPATLTLTAKQEQNLMHHVRAELEAMKTEMGRDEYSDDAGIATAPDVLNRSGSSFLGRRHLAHLVYHQQMEWRKTVMGGIYAHSNVHLPLTARILSQQIARAIKSFFGTAPYFAVDATNSAIDEQLARDLNAWSRHKLETESKMSHHLAQGVELTFVQGESVFKTSKYKLTSFFESYRTIHVDPAIGDPFVALDGDYIYETDTFPEQMVPNLDPVTGEPMIDPTTGQPAMSATGQFLLSRDGQTPKPPQFNFQKVKINLAQVLADNIKSRPIYYLDFLCRLKEPDLQSAATIAHLYDAPIIEFCHRLLSEMFDGAPPEEKLARVAEIANALLSGATTDGTNKGGAAADNARPELGDGQQIVNTQRAEPTKELAEVWLWYDVFADGNPRSIMVLTDSDGVLPIFYDYAANVTHDGQRPFDVLRINPVTNRWYGMGNVEKFWDLQSTADLILNRAFFAQSRAGRIDFAQPDAVVSGDMGQLNWGGTCQLAAGKTAQDAFQSIYLQDTKSNTLMDMLQTVMQAAQSMSAVTNVNDGQMAGMDTAKLATGIKNLERSGEELFMLWLFHLSPGVEAVMQRGLGVVVDDLANNKESLVRFFDRLSSALIELDPASITGLTLDAKLELTSYKSQSQLTQAQMGYNMLQAYLSQANPVIQKRLRPLVNQFLRALEILGADEMTADFTPEEMAMIPVMPPTDATGVPTLPNPDTQMAA